MTSLDLTTSARAALRESGFSRRNFLTASGALIVSFRLAGDAAAQVLQGPSAGAPPMGQLDSWVAIAADGSVTGYSGKEELGQGIWTAQTQLVAEELCVPLARVRLIYCDTAMTPDQTYTSGSQSHPANFNHANLAQACATAREALVRMAAERLGAPVEGLTAANGVIGVTGDASRQISYAQLVGGRKFNLALDPNARRRHPSEWTVLGKPVRRPDLPALATGQFEFVHNVRVPGMLHGKVVRPPVVGAHVISVDRSSVKDLPGEVKVVVRQNFVGVVAQKPWQAIQAAARLKVNWSAGSGLPDHADFYNHLRHQQPTRDTLAVDSKDVEQTLAGAAKVLQATYQHPYQMHGSLGSSCAVADVRGERATIWSPTQGVWYQRSTAAMILGLKPENIHVIFRRGAGCYGLNGADAVTFDAMLLSQAVQQPVRVQLSRQDEMAWENYGQAFVIEERAGLDAAGNIIAWDHESWSPVLGSRPGAAMPGNIVTGSLIGYQPAPFVPRAKAPEPTEYNNGNNHIPSYVAGRVGGENRGTGTVRSERVLTHNCVSALWTGPLRSPGRLQNTFAHEGFMDELAFQVKADPVEYRLRHLSDPRLIDVLQSAAKGAGWEKRPSPRPGNARTGVAAGRGVSCVHYEGANGYSSVVVELEVDQETGGITVQRIVVAADVGPISNPDGLRNQIEGGALQALSRALGEEVTWDAGKVTSIDWRTYHSLPVGFALPRIESVLLNRPDQPANGAGETSVTVMAGAVGNAIFDAIGVRLRQIPFTAERINAALSARA